MIMITVMIVMMVMMMIVQGKCGGRGAAIRDLAWPSCGLQGRHVSDEKNTTPMWTDFCQKSQILKDNMFVISVFLPSPSTTIITLTMNVVKHRLHVCYKVGQIRILQLREQSKQRLGDKFDIRSFHDVVLECAGPLDILEQRVTEYINNTATA